MRFHGVRKTSVEKFSWIQLLTADYFSPQLFYTWEFSTFNKKAKQKHTLKWAICAVTELWTSVFHLLILLFPISFLLPSQNRIMLCIVQIPFITLKKKSLEACRPLPGRLFRHILRIMIETPWTWKSKVKVPSESRTSPNSNHLFFDPLSTFFAKMFIKIHNFILQIDKWQMSHDLFDWGNRRAEVVLLDYKLGNNVTNCNWD